MKKIRAIIALAAFAVLPLISIADNPSPPPPPPGGPGGGPNPVGTPVDGGMVILLALGIGYGGWKIYQIRKETAEAKGKE
jgi:uncharacterized protein HemX